MKTGFQIICFCGGLTTLLLASCVETKSASEMRRIQENEDHHADPAFHESVWYTGSTNHYHYLWHKDFGLFTGEKWRVFKVPRSQLKLDEGMERPYDRSAKHDEETMRYAAISKDQPYKLRKWLTGREKSALYAKEIRSGERRIVTKTELMPDGTVRTSVGSEKTSAKLPAAPPAPPPPPIPPPP